MTWSEIRRRLVTVPRDGRLSKKMPQLHQVAEGDALRAIFRTWAQGANRSVVNGIRGEASDAKQV